MMNMIGGANASTAMLSASTASDVPNILPMVLLFVVVVGIAAWIYMKKK